MKAGIFLIFILSCVLCKFPPNFIFGASTAAFQIEGAWLQDDKSPSVWDNLAHLPNYTADGTAPDIGADSYNRYEEDIDLLVKAGIKHYRMSISWPRIVPKGRAGAPINEKAITRYRQMFTSMLAKGITPYVTLYHWDLPAILAIQGYGLVDNYFTQDFTYYANTCFERFGDLVKNWYTFNEPWCISLLNDFKKRDIGTKPYLIAHKLLLTHGYVVKLYRDMYKEKQKGTIGIVLNTNHFYPKDPENEDDVKAAKRAMDFNLGWFADPIFLGDYPEDMKKRVGDRLPKFTDEEKNLIKNSVDFLGLNHYSSSLCTDAHHEHTENYWEDQNVDMSNKKEWKFTDMGWAIVPEGIHDLIVEIHNRYLKASGVPLYITENGMANKELSIKQAKEDTARIEYLASYLKNVELAIENEKVNVAGYFVWSLIDNFEWWSGFSKRFGIVRIEYGKEPQRIPKASYYWYSDFIKNQTQINME